MNRLEYTKQDKSTWCYSYTEFDKDDLVRWLLDIEKASFLKEGIFLKGNQFNLNIKLKKPLVEKDFLIESV